jgi:hypothetical protein
MFVPLYRFVSHSVELLSKAHQEEQEYRIEEQKAEGDDADEKVSQFRSFCEKKEVYFSGNSLSFFLFFSYL